MSFKIFIPLVFLLMLVSAASPSPKLHVSLNAAEKALTVVATVTNDGSDPVSVLKAGILYPNPSSLIKVVGPNETALAFEGIKPILDVEGSDGDKLWVSIPAGSTFTNTIDLDTSFDFPGSGEYHVSASGYLQVKPEGKDQILVPYSIWTTIQVSNETTAAQVKTFAAHASLLKRDMEEIKVGKRAPAFIRTNCQGWKRDQLHQALWDAYGVAYVAYTHVPWLEPTFWSFFKTSANAPHVQGKFNAISNTAGAATCTNPPTCVIEVSCEDPNGGCANGNANAISSGDVIYPCEPFWNLPSVGTCANTSRGKADTLLHEIAHSHEIPDIVYGLEGSRNLSPSQAINNADTYRFYARYRSRL